MRTRIIATLAAAATVSGLALVPSALAHPSGGCDKYNAPGGTSSSPSHDKGTPTATLPGTGTQIVVKNSGGGAVPTPNHVIVRGSTGYIETQGGTGHGSTYGGFLQGEATGTPVDGGLYADDTGEVTVCAAGFEAV